MQEMNVNDMSSHLAGELLKEKRADRRWRNIRFAAWFLLIAVIVFKLLSPGSTSVPRTGKSGYVALMRLDGMIAPDREFSSDTVVPMLRKAFADKHAKGVVIDINSPGGTPVQAAIIHDAVLYYKKKYNKKVIIVGEDMLTSGAYYVAVAADKIYVNPNTITGSVGVIMKGFGFVDLIKKLGIERRVYISGADKDRLDPFMPQTDADVKKIRDVMGEVQANFAMAVVEGRKGKLHGTPEELFTGDFWSGQTAKKLGLVDETGNLIDAIQTEFKTTEYKEYGGTPSFIKMISGQFTSSLDAMFYTYL
ncbi:MAG TPA: S49 family peptidase [Gammaproteobacteria bacterium]|nr:S49 family peptidase [Gammaproteobacteria bacterium]